MSQITYLRISNLEAVEGLLNLFMYAEQHWCQWNKLEEAIAEVDYNKLTDEYLDWFIEFMANCCFRVWRSTKEDPELNRVKDEAQAFMIINYDWNAYRFGRQKGLDKDLTTKNIVYIDKDKLDEKEIKWLRSKCK